MAYQPSVLEQIMFDAEIGRRNNPDRNIFQKSVDTVRNRLFGRTVSPSQRTPQQQVEFDRLQNKRIQQGLQKNKIGNTLSNFSKQILGIGPKTLGLGTALGAGAVIGNFMQDNLPESDFTSGRGSGSKALSGKQQRRKDLSAQARTLGKEYTPEKDKTEYKPRRKALEELYPDRYKDTETRTNGKDVVQEGRNFNTMSNQIFDSMLTRNQGLGASDETLAAMRGMRDGTSSLFSSINLPKAESFNSFENPQIAEATGAIQPKSVNPGFSTKDAVQFKQPDSNMPSVATTPGVKMPVEYTNYMRSADPALSSMDAMRMNERQKGLIYASGQYWGEGADGKAVKVDPDLAKKVKRGAEGADELLANFLGRGGLSAAASSPVEAGTDYKVNDYDSQGNLLNDRNLLTFKDGSTRYLSEIPEDEDLSATY